MKMNLTNNRGNRKMIDLLKGAVTLTEENLPLEILALKQRMKDKRYQAPYQRQKDADRLARMEQRYEATKKKISDMAKMHLEIHTKASTYEKKTEANLLDISNRVVANIDKVNEDNAMEILGMFKHELGKRRITKTTYLTEYVWEFEDSKFFGKYYVRTSAFMDIAKKHGLKLSEENFFTHKVAGVHPDRAETGYYVGELASDYSHYIETISLDDIDNKTALVLVKGYATTRVEFETYNKSAYADKLNELFGA